MLAVLTIERERIINNVQRDVTHSNSAPEELIKTSAAGRCATVA